MVRVSPVLQDGFGGSDEESFAELATGFSEYTMTGWLVLCNSVCWYTYTNSGCCEALIDEFPSFVSARLIEYGTFKQALTFGDMFFRKFHCIKGSTHLPYRRQLGLNYLRILPEHSRLIIDEEAFVVVSFFQRFDGRQVAQSVEGKGRYQLSSISSNLSREILLLLTIRQIQNRGHSSSLSINTGMSIGGNFGRFVHAHLKLTVLMS